MSGFANLGEIINRLTGGNSGSPEHIYSFRYPYTAGTVMGNYAIGIPRSCWLMDGLPGNQTSGPGVTPVIPDNTTAGGFCQTDPSGGRTKYLLGFEAYANRSGEVILYDRLLHQSGLSGTVTNPQTVQGNAGTGTCTISNASPAVVSLTGHGYGIGQAVQFTTTGALPTGLSLATNYYVISAGYGANSFEVSASRAGSAVNTSSAGSGTHTVTGRITPALTRYTDGLGNFAFAEVYTAIGTTQQSTTIKYKNDSGSAATSYGIGVGGAAASLMNLPGTISTNFPLASGDVGIQSVDSVTLGGSTGTAGDFGITIGHELARVAVNGAGGGGARDLINGFPDLVDIPAGSCLAMLFVPNLVPSGGTAVGAIHAACHFAEIV